MPRTPRRPDGRAPAPHPSGPAKAGRAGRGRRPEAEPGAGPDRPPRAAGPGRKVAAVRAEEAPAGRKAGAGRGDAPTGRSFRPGRAEASPSLAARPGRGEAPGRSEGPRRGDAPAGRKAGAGRSDAPPPRKLGFGRTPPATVAEDAPPPPRPGAGAGSGAYWIYGQHAVLAALSNPRRKPRRLLVTTDAELTLRDRFTGPWRVTPERADRARFATFLAEDVIHQGIALLAEPLEAVALEDAVAASDGPVLLLDQVTDPRNVGAVLRAAAAFGAACVVLQDRHAPPETGALARAASGTLDIVPVVREVNLSRAIVALQKAGFWVLGLAGDGKRTLAEALPRDRRVALVLGAEDSGMRRLQREHCDELVRLPMAEGVDSLNVAAAAAVALYEVVRR